MKPLSPNTLLQGRYLIVQMIGKGGMGEVYLAVDQRLGSAVALKRTFFSDDETLGNAFEREARTLARLRHAVLPKVSDHFTENDTQYLVMENISGEDLSKRLEMTNKPFPLSWVLFWADQLLDALAYLHSHEPPIIHRDIKPQNLKLTSDNHIVLLDFGLAKNSNAGQTRMTTGGSIVGYTPHYAPMEQIRGTGTSAKSDIYSLAATLYQLLTAQVPPDALTRADSILNGAPDPTVAIDEINPEVPKEISDVFLKAMSLSGEQRYATARDMQKALREAHSHLQNVMSAETLAFNAPGAEASHPISQVPQQPTNYAPPVQPQTVQPPRVDSQGWQNQANANNPPPFSSQPTAQTPVSNQPDFEKTIRDDSFDLSSLQSQQKTEVLPADIAAQAKAHAAQQQPPQNFEATVPLINFDQTPAQPTQIGATQAVSAMNSQPRPEPQASYGSPFNTNAAGAPTQTETPFSPAPLYADANAKKKSGGKGLAIAGGVGALGVVVLGAGIGGWYLLKGQNAEVTTNPTPKPTVAVTATPTPAPTLEAVTNTNSNSGTNANGKTTEVVAVTPTPNKVAPITAPTRVVTQSNPVRTPPPIRPTTPKPAKTTGAGRTDILQ